jgi:hypothetical protein
MRSFPNPYVASRARGSGSVQRSRGRFRIQRILALRRCPLIVQLTYHSRHHELPWVSGRGVGFSNHHCAAPSSKSCVDKTSISTRVNDSQHILVFDDDTPFVVALSPHERPPVIRSFISRWVFRGNSSRETDGNRACWGTQVRIIVVEIEKWRLRKSTTVIVAPYHDDLVTRTVMSRACQP